MADGFLGRWARRKNDASLGRPLDEPQAAPAVEELPTTAPQAKAASAPAVADAPTPVELPEKKQPSMEDVQTLTQQSDYSSFVTSEVDEGVRNAAMKKLFTDPHFNKIDWLDVYMDDYNKLEPMPLSMMKKLASAKFLKLVDDDEDKNKKLATAPPDNERLPAQADAASEVSQTDLAHDETAAVNKQLPQAAEPNTTEDHDHTDLRLQQDHAAGAGDTGRGPQ